MAKRYRLKRIITYTEEQKVIIILDLMQKIKQKHKGLIHDETGFIDCPICGGRIKYYILCYNLHIWAKCTNADQGCIEWMQ